MTLLRAVPNLVSDFCCFKRVVLPPSFGCVQQ